MGPQGPQGPQGPEGPQGPAGSDGKSGKTPVIYPAGEFNLSDAANKKYVGDSNQAPYVFYNVNSDLKGFYIAYGTPTAAPSVANVLTRDDDIDWINIPDNADKWIQMDKFNAIYSDIGVFKHALVGK